MFLTYKFRVKDASSRRHLIRHARAVNYVWNGAPTEASAGLPPHPSEWVGVLSSTVDLTPKTAILGSVEMGVDNRLVQSRLGVTHRIWGK